MREIDQFALSSITRKLAGVDHGKVSVCIVAKNEQERLPACINSTLGFADEIIVVDRGSGDRTVEVARELGAKVFFLPLNSDFARIWNFALDLALNNWVLVLEPGEKLVMEGAHKEKILHGDKDIWLCPVVDIAGIPVGNYQPQLKPRLFKRSMAQGFKGEGCEQLEYSPGARVGALEHLHIDYNCLNLPEKAIQVSTRSVHIL